MTQNINRLIKSLWIRCCRFDNIPIDTYFAKFSDKNPYLKRYNKMMKLKQLGRKRIYSYNKR